MSEFQVLNSKREEVELLRGNFIEKIIVSVEEPRGTLSVCAFGFENYPEPQYYVVHLNGEPIFHNELVLLNYDEFMLLDDMRRAGVIDSSMVTKLTNLLAGDERFGW